MTAAQAAKKCREIADRLWESRDRKSPSRDVLSLDSGDLHMVAGLLEGRKWTLYVCPSESCIFVSMTPGKCRSHPYPCRAMGPELEKVEVLAI
jgi:hypothetical protein